MFFILKIQRIKINSRLYQFSNYKQEKTSKNAPERIDQLYVTIEQQKGSRRVIYYGIARPIGFCSFFLPLFKYEHVKKNKTYIGQILEPKNYQIT